MPRNPEAKRTVRIKARKTPKQKARQDNAIVIERIPDPPHRVIKQRSQLAGHTTGLGPWEWLTIVFQANESLPKKKRLADESIRVAMLKEFAGLHRKGQKGISDRLQANPWLIAKMRTQYNKGELTRGVIPSPLSRRYGNDGEPLK